MTDRTPEQEKKLRIAFQQTFNTDAGQEVLKDLQERCYKYTSTLDANPYVTAANEGAREVLLTIEELMSDEGIAKLADTSGKE